MVIKEASLNAAVKEKLGDVQQSSDDNISIPAHKEAFIKQLKDAIQANNVPSGGSIGQRFTKRLAADDKLKKGVLRRV